MDRRESGLVSIVVPVYNAGAFIAETIYSVQAQTYRAWELLLVDDCSQDNSREIIRTVFAADETYAVCLKENNIAIGCAAITVGAESNLKLPETEGEIGYWIGVPFWGQGLIPEAVRELIRRGFEELKLQKLWCGYFEGNTKSRRVQEKCGFIYHHTNKDMHWELMDDIRTEHVTCLTREEWEKNSREEVIDQ